MKSSLYIYIFFLLFFVSVPSNVFAQDLDEEVKEEAIEIEAESKEHAFIIDGQVRTRGEYRSGAIQPLKEGQEAAEFINERARLSIGYAASGVQLQISAQHAGVWGNQSITGSNNGFCLNEAWGQVTTNNHLFSARVGRQALSYDNGRILGSNEWATTGYFHNAIKLAYEDEWNKLHILAAFNQNEERAFNTYYSDSTGLYKNMEGIWYHFGNMSFPLQASVLLLNTGYEAGTFEKSKTIYRQTMGAIVNYDTYHWGIQLEGYYQMGKLNTKMKTNAWMAALNVRYSPNNKISFKAGYDLLSGSNKNDSVNHSFLPVYGSLHSFYGSMDYFGKNYFTMKNSGLSDAHFSVKWNAYKDLYIKGTYHFLSTSADQIRLSHEVDLRADWRFKKDVTLSAGYSFALNTTNMNRLLGGSNEKWQHFGFVQLNIAPRLLFTKW